MDRIDRKILSLYQHDTRRIAESIGNEVGLSAAAVQRRLKRLRSDGVIAAEIAVLDKNAIGEAIVTCIVNLSMAAAPSPGAHLDRFRRQMIDNPMVQQCYHVTGTSDFIVIIIAKSMEAYGAFARRWFESNPHVTRYDTHVALERVKVGLSLPAE
jgi:Lrp/AsnC family leucine-responsive transcriptional regulator